MSGVDRRVNPEVKPDASAKTCEVTVTLQLLKWLPRLRWRLPCKREAEWISINMCCGTTSRACTPHYRLAEKPMRGKSIRCVECGCPDSIMEWSELL